MGNPPLRLFEAQGRIQDFLIGGSSLQTGFNLTILSEYLLLFPDFSENSPENKIILSHKGVHSNPSGSTTEVLCVSNSNKAYSRKL